MSSQNVKENYELSQQDQAIANMILKYPGIKNTELAGLFSLTDRQIITIKNKPAFKQRFIELQKDLMDILKDGQKIAARVLIKLAQDKDPRVQLQACKLLLAPYTNAGLNNVNQQAPVSYIHVVKYGEQGQVIKENRFLKDESEIIIDV